MGFFGINVIDQWQRGIVFTLGKYGGVVGPGIVYVVPFVQKLIRIDIRIKTIDIAKQEVITKDNVPVMVNAVVYFSVTKPEAVVLLVRDFTYAVTQYAQTALRDVVGNVTLDTVLTERDQLAEKIKAIVDKETADWGVDIQMVKIQDIELPADMKRIMARQAEAEREKRATVIMSEGELIGSENLAKAAVSLAKMPGALHLRTLQTISDIGGLDAYSYVIVAPTEILRLVQKLTNKE